MNNEPLVIVDGVRTPFCRAGTDLAPLAADELGHIAVSSLLTRTGLDPALVDEVIFGCVIQPPEAANLARVITLRAGLPQSCTAVTVHRNCASGFEAITHAEERLRAGMGSIFIVGGVESMSNVPLLYPPTAAAKFTRLARAKSFGQRLKAFTAFRPTDFRPRHGLLLGLTDPVCGLNMGETAEVLAREFQISRSAQDDFALQSHRRAAAAHDRLAEEICPVFQPTRPAAVTDDNGIRANQSADALAGLKPVFDRKYGSVTPGNASQITDGAVALLVMGQTHARELGYTPLGTLTGYAYAGCDPARMGLGPVNAIALAAKLTGLTLADADIIEINEAFAAQVLACTRSLGGIPAEKLNVNGGAIALGHPVGATGARLVLTALKELKRRNAHRALVAACVGGGQGAALWLERT